MKKRLVCIVISLCIVFSVLSGVYAQSEVGSAGCSGMVLATKPSKVKIANQLNKFFKSHSKYKYLVVFGEECYDDSGDTYTFVLRSTGSNTANVHVGTLKVNWKSGKCNIEYLTDGKDSFYLGESGGGTPSASEKYKAYVKKNGISSYKIVDVDGNGVKELCCNDMGFSTVFTYNKKKSKMVEIVSKPSGKVYSCPSVNVKKRQVRIWCGSTKSTCDYYFYSIKGKTAKLVVKISESGEKVWNNDRTNYKVKKTFYINSKKVSKSSYNQKLKKMSKGFK